MTDHNEQPDPRARGAAWLPESTGSPAPPPETVTGDEVSAALSPENLAAKTAAEDFARLFPGDVFGAERSRIALRLNRAALLAQYSPAELVAQARRHAEMGSGQSIDDHPYLVLDPELPASMINSMIGADAKAEAARLAAEMASSTREAVTSAVLDRISGDLGNTMIRVVACAIVEVGGNWTVYRRPLSEADARRALRWGDLDIVQRIGLLRLLSMADLNFLIRLSSVGLSATPAELGN